jgi:hypothetical protein
VLVPGQVVDQVVGQQRYRRALPVLEVRRQRRGKLTDGGMRRPRG